MWDAWVNYEICKVSFINDKKYHQLSSTHGVYISLEKSKGPEKFGSWSWGNINRQPYYDSLLKKKALSSSVDLELYSMLRLFLSCHMYHIRHIGIIQHKILLWTFFLSSVLVNQSITCLGNTQSSPKRPKTTCHKALAFSALSNHWSTVSLFLLHTQHSPLLWHISFVGFLV